MSFRSSILPVSLVAGVCLFAAPARAQGAAPAAAPAARPAERVTGTGPNGAIMRCRDGSYVTTTADDSCAAKGGILVRFPLNRVPNAPAPRARVRAPEVAAPVLDAPPTEAAPASRANVTVPAVRPPENATLLCRDGTYIVADTVRARCAARGGVRVA